MYTNNRDAYRNTFFTVWQKFQKKLPLDALETQLIHIILLHPEYQKFLHNTDLQQQEFTPEENPFLHMSLHLALHEQLQTNRPSGISQIYQQLKEKYQDEHEVKHHMMRVLAHLLWQAQQTGEMPDDKTYLEALREMRMKP